jgi:hypothetical protein
LFSDFFSEQANNNVIATKAILIFFMSVCILAQNNENCWKARLNCKKNPNLFINWDFV